MMCSVLEAVDPQSRWVRLRKLLDYGNRQKELAYIARGEQQPALSRRTPSEFPHWDRHYRAHDTIKKFMPRYDKERDELHARLRWNQQRRASQRANKLKGKIEAVDPQARWVRLRKLTDFSKKQKTLAHIAHGEQPSPSGHRDPIESPHWDRHYRAQYIVKKFRPRSRGMGAREAHAKLRANRQWRANKLQRVSASDFGLEKQRKLKDLLQKNPQVKWSRRVKDPEERKLRLRKIKNFAQWHTKQLIAADRAARASMSEPVVGDRGPTYRIPKAYDILTNVARGHDILRKRANLAVKKWTLHPHQRKGITARMKDLKSFSQRERIPWVPKRYKFEV